MQRCCMFSLLLPFGELVLVSGTSRRLLVATPMRLGQVVWFFVVTLLGGFRRFRMSARSAPQSSVDVGPAVGLPWPCVERACLQHDARLPVDSADPTSSALARRGSHPQRFRATQ